MAIAICRFVSEACVVYVLIETEYRKGTIKDSFGTGRYRASDLRSITLACSLDVGPSGTVPLLVLKYSDSLLALVVVRWRRMAVGTVPTGLGIDQGQHSIMKGQ